MEFGRSWGLHRLSKPQVACQQIQFKLSQGESLFSSISLAAGLPHTEF